MISPTRNDLSRAQAAKLALLSQGVHKAHDLGRGRNAVARAIRQLGYIQIDTISVVERAHHHTLWNRVNGYKSDHLHRLQQGADIFEYWSHAAAYLPIEDYRFSLPRKARFADQREHFFKVDAHLLQQVLQRIRDEGPLQARDFEHTRKGNNGWWEWKPAKRALEQLFMQGDLMISERRGFQKVFDLPERILPSGTDTRMPDKSEYAQHLILRFLHANALGSPAQMGYLRKGVQPAIRGECRRLAENGQIIPVRYANEDWYALPDIEQRLRTPLSQQKVKILSPFDNVLIQRQRARQIFDFDYQIECYVPERKRRYGYFVLPILWGQRFAGRMDAKIDRANGILTIKQLFIETAKEADFLHALQPELANFLRFNGGTQVRIENTVHLVA